MAVVVVVVVVVVYIVGGDGVDIPRLWRSCSTMATMATRMAAVGGRCLLRGAGVHIVPGNPPININIILMPTTRPPPSR